MEYFIRGYEYRRIYGKISQKSSESVSVTFDVAIDERASSRYGRGGRGGKGGGERERVKERKKEALYTLAFG